MCARVAVKSLVMLSTLLLGATFFAHVSKADVCLADPDDGFSHCGEYGCDPDRSCLSSPPDYFGELVCTNNIGGAGELGCNGESSDCFNDGLGGSDDHPQIYSSCGAPDPSQGGALTCAQGEACLDVKTWAGITLHWTCTQHSGCIWDLGDTGCSLDQGDNLGKRCAIFEPIDAERGDWIDKWCLTTGSYPDGVCTDCAGGHYPSVAGDPCDSNDAVTDPGMACCSATLQCLNDDGNPIADGESGTCGIDTIEWCGGKLAAGESCVDDSSCASNVCNPGTGKCSPVYQGQSCDSVQLDCACLQGAGIPLTCRQNPDEGGAWQCLPPAGTCTQQWPWDPNDPPLEIPPIDHDEPWRCDVFGDPAYGDCCQEAAKTMLCDDALFGSALDGAGHCSWDGDICVNTENQPCDTNPATPNPTDCCGGMYCIEDPSSPDYGTCQPEEEINPGTSCSVAGCDGCPAPGYSCISSVCIPDVSCAEIYVAPPYTGPILSFERVISTIFAFLYPTGLVIGLFFNAKAGYCLMTSEGDPHKLKDCKEELTHAVLGTLFILLSIAILRVIINTILGGSVGF